MREHAMCCGVMTALENTLALYSIKDLNQEVFHLYSFMLNCPVGVALSLAFSDLFKSCQCARETQESKQETKIKAVAILVHEETIPV